MPNGNPERTPSAPAWSRTAAPLALAAAAAVLALVSAWSDPPAAGAPGAQGPDALADWVWALLIITTAAVAALALGLQARALVAARARERALERELAQRQAELALARHERATVLERISHDLRTPLASMQGYLELLLLRHGSLDAAEAQNYLETAARHSERLSRLVHDLLELTRLQSESAFVQREPFPVAELAHDVAQRFAAAAQRAGVALDVRAPDADAGFVQADLRLVERLLSNLLDNALRHTPAGGRVTIEVAGLAQKGAEAAGATAGATAATEGTRITVADTGEGIEPAALAGIFERYATASRVGDTGSSTPGLGLAIAQRIAQLHGSALDLQSTPGAGTRVTFTLPAAPRTPRPPPR